MFLLSTPTFLDLIAGHAKVQAWVDVTPAHAIHVSTVTIGEAKARIEVTPRDDGKDESEQALYGFLGLFRTVGTVLSFGEDESDHWAYIANLDLKCQEGGFARDLTDTERMVVATAANRRLTLVERRQPYHGQISNLKTHDPY